MSQKAGTWSEVSLRRSAPDRESAIEDCQVQVSRTAMSAIPARSPSRDSKSDDWASRVHKQPFIPGDQDRERLGDPARGSATVPRGVGVGGAARIRGRAGTTCGSTRRISTPRRTARRPATRSPLGLRRDRHGDRATFTSVSSEPFVARPATPSSLVLAIGCGDGLMLDRSFQMRPGHG